MQLNHNVFNTRTYTIVGVIIVMVLIFIGFRECTPKEDNTGYQLALDMHKQVKHENDSIAKENKRILAERAQLQLVNAGLQDDLHLYQRQTIKYSGDVRSLSIKLDEARKNKDTAQYIEGCDSLQKVATDQQGIIDHQNIITDALIKNYDLQITKADSSNNALIHINNKLQTGYDFAIQETRIQKEKKDKAEKQVKREKTKTCILAGVVIATIVYSIIPK